MSESYEYEKALRSARLALITIYEGSASGGVWRDLSGNECYQGSPNCDFEAFDGEEQDIWLAAVAEIAEAQIADIDKALGETPTPEGT